MKNVTVSSGGLSFAAVVSSKEYLVSISSVGNRKHDDIEPLGRLTNFIVKLFTIPRKMINDLPEAVGDASLFN